MCYWKDNHGNIYGPFGKQEDDLPNAGEVVRFYREQKRLSQGALAVLLGVSRKWVINMELQNKVPELLSRRRAIAEILKIPPMLLGMGLLGSDTFLMPLEESRSHISVLSYSMQEANEYLDAAWEAYTFTGSLDVLSGVQRWKARIKEQVAQRGWEWEKNLDPLHRYEHFLLVVGRQRQDYTGTDPIGLIDLAEQIKDPDTLGISLYRRGKMYFQQKNYKAALEDIRKALSQVEHAGPQVKGVSLVGCGPILAHYATDKTDVQEVLDLLDKAHRYIEQAKGHPDPFRARFDESQYFLARASSIISLLRLDVTLLDEVFEALDLAQETTRPQYIQRRANMQLHYAEAAFYAGEYLSAVATALEALELAQSVHAIQNSARIQKLYEKLTQTKIKDSSELRKLRQALTKQAY